MKYLDKINYKLINLSLLLIIFFLLFKTFDAWLNAFLFLKKVFLPFIISFIIAYSLTPIVEFINKKIKNNTLTIFIILIIIISMLFFILSYSLPILINQIISIIKEIEPFIVNLSNKLTFFNNDFWQTIFTNKLQEMIMTISNKPLKIITNSLSYIINLIIVIVLSVYFLLNMEKIKIRIKLLFKNQKKTLLTLQEINSSINQYLKSLFLIFIIEMIEYTLLYLIVGHPNYLLLGVLAGIATVIPYFGGLFTNILALVTAVYISKNLFIACAIIAIIFPIVDVYIIDPKIYHKTTKINPLKSIFAIIISGKLFGIFGILIAIPLYLIINIIIKNYLIESKIFIK